MAQGKLKTLGLHLRNRLVSGLLLLIPLVVTVAVIKILLDLLTRFVRPVLEKHISGIHEALLTLLALVITLGAIYLVGLITSLLVGRRLVSWGEQILLRVPIVKTIYSSAKQVVDAFSATGKSSFDAVVALEYPRRGTWTLGFATGTIINPEGQVLVTVFVPTTPNPTSGFLLMFPEDDVIYTDISVEDGLKMIVSGGMLAPAKFQHKLNGAKDAKSTPSEVAVPLGE